MALRVKLHRVVGKDRDRRYVPVEFGRRDRRSKEEFAGPFYLRYGTKYESVGMDFKAGSKPCSAGRLRLRLWVVA
jgi:hypothetical protein